MRGEIDSDCPFMPTEEQIRQACLDIQATWTEEERERRMLRTVDGLGIPPSIIPKYRECMISGERYLFQPEKR
jgi:hypothetical protein